MVSSPHVSPRSRLAALLLCCFAGFLGAHRLYTGKIGTAVLMLVTFGGLGLWTLLDFILIAVGAFADKEGRLLLRWDAEYLPVARGDGRPAQELMRRMDRIDGELGALQAIMEKMDRRFDRVRTPR